jgi:hypothetical protein
VRGGGALAWVVALALAGCGPSSEITSLTQREVMNVAAWVGVRSSGAISVRAVARSPGGHTVRSPEVPPSSDGTITVALLGLRADTDYEVHLEAAASPGGAAVRSEPMTIHTGALPAGLPAVAAQGEGGGLTLVGMPNPGGSTHAAMVVDEEGAVVWYHVTDQPVTDLQRQPDGTYTACERSPGGARFDQFDREGRLLRTWSAPAESNGGTGWHELRLLPGGDALLLGVQTQVRDLSALGGSDTAVVAGNILYRLSGGGEVRFRWSAFDHFAIDDIDPAVDVTQVPVDWTHADAIDVMAGGDLLVTFRNLSQVVRINGESGEVLWRLGGRRSDFVFPNDPLGGPSFPHGARQLTNGNILLFDNGNGRAAQESRAVEYSLDVTENAHLVWQYAPSPPRFASDLGFAQRLWDGSTLVSFGTEGRVEEVSASGQLSWSLQSSDPSVPIYRALRVETLY